MKKLLVVLMALLISCFMATPVRAQWIDLTEHDGQFGISTTTPTWWRTNPPPRIRISRDIADGNGAKHFLITPYQYGMAFEYFPGIGTVEWWVGDFSVHAPAGSSRTARFWVGDQLDSGGLFARAWSKGASWSEVASQTFAAQSHGNLRLRVVDEVDAITFRWGDEAKSDEPYVFRKDCALLPAVRSAYRASDGSFGITTNIVLQAGDALTIRDGIVVRFERHDNHEE